MTPVAQEAASTTMIQKIASATTYAGAGAAVVGGWSTQELLAAGGFILAVGSFAMNWYYNHRRMKLMERQEARGDRRG